MRVVISKSAELAVAVGICLASVAFGDVTFKDLAPPPGNSLAGIYTAPYQASINSGPSVPVICDDFADENSPPDSWTALTTDLSAFTGTTPTVATVYYGATPNTLTGAELQTKDYVAAAILSMEILGLATPATSVGGANNTEDLSYALWELFDPGSGAGTPTNTLVTAGDFADQAAAAADLTSALTAAGTTTGAQYLANESTLLHHSVDVTIYTPTTNGTSPNSPTQHQEFIGVTVPEPATWAVLGFDFVGAGIVGLYFRRRRS
jgi:hypothetical protein